MDHNDRLRTLFAESRKSMIALGDENRQEVIIALLNGPCEDMRVGEIKERAHLSQPAVSHHLKVLLEANLLTMRKIGTMNYYQLNPDSKAITHIYELCSTVLMCLEESSAAAAQGGGKL